MSPLQHERINKSVPCQSHIPPQQNQWFSMDPNCQVLWLLQVRAFILRKAQVPSSCFKEVSKKCPCTICSLAVVHSSDRDVIRFSLLLLMFLRSQSKSKTEQWIWGVCAPFARYIVLEVHKVIWFFPSMALWQQRLKSEAQLAKQIMIISNI